MPPPPPPSSSSAHRDLSGASSEAGPSRHAATPAEQERPAKKRKSRWASPTPSPPRSTSDRRKGKKSHRAAADATVASSSSATPDGRARRPPPAGASASSSPRSSHSRNTGADGRSSSYSAVQSSTPILRPHPAPPRSLHPPIAGCRSVYNFERLNHIEEGSYGVVFRARDKDTGEIVALKKLKMDGEKNGFPITSLREIRTLMQAKHPNVVDVKEIVVGDTLTQIYIVMEFVEHDLKTLLSSMRTPFLQSEIKTLMKQLLSAIRLLHSSWIIHRDLKTSNLLMNNRGMMKVADFGLARTYGDPLDDMTSLVVTLWYRAPELLLNTPSYNESIDMWSIGCIFAELINKEPLFPGKTEVDQLNRIFRLLGPPNERIWPGVSSLPLVQSKKIDIPGPSSSSSSFATSLTTTTRESIRAALRSRFRYFTENGIDLLSRLLCYDPDQRISAEEALKHPYFTESPPPAHPDSFGSFPSIAAGEKKKDPSPSAPQRLADQKLAYQLEFDL